LKDIGKQILRQDCPILVCWAGYVGFKLGGYKQPGSKENKSSVRTLHEGKWALQLPNLYIQGK